MFVRVRLKKTSQSIEVKLVQHLNSIKTFNGPNKDSVKKYIDRLKESDLDILEAVQQKDSCLAIWLWCLSSYGVQRLKFMLNDRSGSKSDLTHLFSKLFNHLLYVKRWYGLRSEDTVDIRKIDFDEAQLEKTFSEIQFFSISASVYQVIYSSLSYSLFSFLRDAFLSSQLVHYFSSEISVVIMKVYTF